MATVLDDDIDTADLPVDVGSLEQLRDALRSGIGALSSQADQIGQMRGMFDDEDDAIQNAVDAGEHAETYLENAVSFIEGLLNRRQALGGGRTVETPVAEDLLALHDDIAEELKLVIGDAGANSDLEGTVDMSVSMTESVLDALLASARMITAARAPVEIALYVDGGVIQDVHRVEGDERSVHVYVHDHDIDGHDKDPARDKELGHIRFADTPRSRSEHCHLSVQNGDPIPSDGPLWTTLRSEAERLGLHG